MLFMVVLVAYIAILAIITWRARSNSADHYLIAGRSVSAFGVLAALAASFRDGAGIAAWVGLGVAFGFGSLWLVVGMSSALLLFALIAPMIREAAAKNGWDTPADLLRARYGGMVEFTGTLVILATAVLYAAAQIYVAGALLSAYSGLPSVVALGVIALVTAGYVSFGGYSTVTATDKLQWLLIMAILVLPFALLGGPNVPALESLWSAGPSLSIGFAALSFLVILSSGDVWQRAFSAKTGLDARLGFGLTIPVYFAISVALVVFASSIGGLIAPERLGDAIFLIPQIEQLPALVSVGFGVFAIAALMSTLDTQTFLFSSTLVDRFLPKSTSDERRRTTVGLVSFLFVIALGAIALTVGDIVQFLFSAVTLGTVMGPVFLFGFLPERWRPSDLLTTVGIVLGVVVYGLLFMQGAFANLLFNSIPAVVTLLSLVILRPFIK